MPVHQEARAELALLLEDLLVRRISYKEFCDSSWRLSTLTDEGDWIGWPQDRGASIILDVMTVENYGKKWQERESREPKHESEDTGCLMRYLLFLRGDWEYEWDSREYDLDQFFYLFTDLLHSIPGVRRLLSRILPERFDGKLWPFCRHDDLEKALKDNIDYLPHVFGVEHK